MLGWLYKLIIGNFGCNHKWDMIAHQSIGEGDNIIGTRFTLQCQHCGNIKFTDNF